MLLLFLPILLGPAQRFGFCESGHILRVQRAATSLLNAMNEAEGVSGEIGNLGGQAAIEPYFMQSDGVTPRDDLVNDLGEIMAALVTFDAIAALRAAGHGTNLSKLRQG